MLEEVSELMGLQVYTSQGIFLGNVSNLIVDMDNAKVDSLFITDTNPVLVEESKNVAVPYRWIQAIGDIIILRFFPGHIAIRHEEKKEEEKSS